MASFLSILKKVSKGCFPKITKSTMQHVIPTRLIGHFKIFSNTSELIPSAVDIPITTKLMFLTGKVI